MVWGVGHGVWWVGTGYGVVGRVVGLAVLYRALLYRALLYRAWLYCTGLAVLYWPGCTGNGLAVPVMAKAVPVMASLGPDTGLA